jgi:hypothetical protein
MNEYTDKHGIICEACGWEVCDDMMEVVELQKHSPAGEDFSFCVDKENFVENVEEYAKHFDIDEHIEMWIEARKNGFRGVPSTRELVNDAEAIAMMIKGLAIALTTYHTRRKTPRFSHGDIRRVTHKI